VNKQFELPGILFLKARTPAGNSTFVLDMKDERMNRGSGSSDTRCNDTIFFRCGVNTSFIVSRTSINPSVKNWQRGLYSLSLYTWS